MMTEGMDGRQQRGLELAATARIVRKGSKHFSVPSQSSGGRYTVIQVHEELHCTCPDYELRGLTCKHGYAVQFFLKRETKPDGTVIETRAARMTYSQNWPAYNAAQVNEKAEFCSLLKDLVSSVPSPEQKRGRPSLPLADMIFAAGFKVYSTVSARRFMTDLRSATAQGFIAKTPHYNSIFNVLDKPSLTPVLRDLVTRSALPLQAVETSFAVDATGFGLNRFYRHFTEKWEARTRHDWLKLHATVGVKTNVITAVEVTDKDTHDGALLRGMVESTAEHFTVSRVTADKAYSNKRNVEMLAERNIETCIPFRSISVGTGTSAVWNRLFHFFSLHRDEFLNRYHVRSNAESTFSAMKRKFGETLRSKTATAQVNEMLLKVICHNVVCVIHEMHESGIAAAFPMLTPRCPEKDDDAQQFTLKP